MRRAWLRKYMTSRKNYAKSLLRFICMGLGLALAFYGVLLLFALDQLALGKFSAASRDTSTAILFGLIGVVIFIYGMWLDDGE